MIIWDTNTVYYVCGESVSGKCDIDALLTLAKIEKTCISSMSICEILCHYRHKANYIRRMFSFLRINGIGEIYHPLLPDNRMSVVDLSYIKQKELDDYVNTAISKKVLFESAYAFSMFSVMFMSALWFSLPDDCESHNIIANLLKVWIDTCETKRKNFFIQAFEYGYKIKDCENVVKAVFEYALNEDLQFFQPLAVEVKLSTGTNTISEVLDSSELNYSVEVFQKKIKKIGNTSQYVKKLVVEYRKKFGTEQYKSFMKNMNTIFENTFKRSSGIWHDSMYKYFIDICIGIHEGGSLFKKNDILDGLILQHLYVDENNKIITFDKGMIKHLTRYAQIEKTYENSLNAINSCTKP